MSRDFVFTSESVGEGHPDKVADQISDSVLDAILAQDPTARVACETMVNTGMVILSGEITTSAIIDYQEIARNAIKKIGYNSSEMGFDYASCAVLVTMDKQSVDIAAGVNVGEGIDLDQGAGDQGLMFGYASNETDVLMPMPVYLSHQLMEKQAEVRKSGVLKYLRPDAKSQVTVRYVDSKPVAIDAVVLSTQHSADVSHEDLVTGVMKEIIHPVLDKTGLLHDKTDYHINPTGRFVIGGPVGDCGVTGRKIIVDTYGGFGHHGGGAFSGKDPTKVDRSACYMMRYVAKNIVAAELADRCEVQVAYAIGVAHPLSVMVNTFGTGKVDEEKLAEAVREVFDLRPKGIVQELDLLRPIYAKTAAYGHFGRELPEFTWEKTDKVDALKAAVAK